MYYRNMKSRFPLESAVDFAASRARRMARIWGEMPTRACENCGTTEGTIEQIWTDDGRKPLLCDDCAGEVRRLEKLADELAALPSCDLRQQIIDTAESTGELVNRLRGHDLAQCAACACCASGKAA